MTRRGGRAGPEAVFAWASKRSWQVSAAMEEASPDLPRGLENLLGKRVSWHVAEKGAKKENRWEILPRCGHSQGPGAQPPHGDLSPSVQGGWFLFYLRENLQQTGLFWRER